MDTMYYRTKRGRVGEIKKYKCPHTWVNHLMNKDHRQPDVLYLSTLIGPLVRAELSMSVVAIQAAIVDSYLHIYRKV